ncbi:hypothetical protein BCR43DRAFT_498699 [Syncephalastrum racemosum]|uniref:Uncharacterized protein n=1 Tax=Syncephalastrum racemosum TaxID=13706 RepID=A0A1X2H1A0_SYNRA|nr:hypothetical protein BCR43DRAFT_498699 [Syncephalastrum racemosum]
MPDILSVVRSCLARNQLIENASLWVRGLRWGELGTSDGIDQLVSDVEQRWDTRIDYILGSDTFYDPADFNKLLMTAAYVIHRHNKSCKFITAYQERRSFRSPFK